MRWVNDSRSGGARLYAGGFCVGTVFHNGLAPKSETKSYNIACKLPDADRMYLDKLQSKFETIGEAKQQLEAICNKWFEHVAQHEKLMVPRVGSTPDPITQE